MNLGKVARLGPSYLNRILVVLGITFGFVLPLLLLVSVFLIGGVTPDGQVPPWFFWSALGVSITAMLLLAVFVARKGWDV